MTSSGRWQDSARRPTNAMTWMPLVSVAVAACCVSPLAIPHFVSGEDVVSVCFTIFHCQSLWPLDVMMLVILLRLGENLQGSWKLLDLISGIGRTMLPGCASEGVSGQQPIAAIAGDIPHITWGIWFLYHVIPLASTNWDAPHYVAKSTAEGQGIQEIRHAFMIYCG